MMNLSRKCRIVTIVIVAIFAAAIVASAAVVAANVTMIKTKNPSAFVESEKASMETEVLGATVDTEAVDEIEPVIINEPVRIETKAADTWTEQWHFYNADLQDNGDDLDDWNFGPNPMADATISSEEIANAIKAGENVKKSDVLAKVSAEVVDKNFMERLRSDPVLGAADMAWFDSILGTDYLGVFYSECNEKWDATMNAAAKAWIQDKADYDATLDAFEEYLDRATKVELKYVESGLDDQMYMNPATKDGTPEIIVMETLNHDGWFLVYTFTIKETTTKEVAYRIECGYQPTNVAEIMEIKATANKAAKKAAKKVVVGGSASTIQGSLATPTPVPRPTPTPTPKPTPTPTPKPKPPYDKDPTDGTPVLPNDVPGPGPDTNNGIGAQYSTMDLPDNSNHLTPEEYQQAIQQLQDANNTTREGGDSNIPSTPPPDVNTAIDNNAQIGTGNGGIDTPTPVQDSSVADDQAGVTWDGPPL